jgi:hypothetical protein
MMNDFYIEQRLEDKSDNAKKKLFSVDELINSEHKVIIVLAEPGAGKTRLTEEIKNRTAANLVKATIFLKYLKTTNANLTIIDGFDEVAKLSNDNNISIIVKASELPSDKIMITSRSGEWADSDTQTVINCFNATPLIVCLLPFDRTQQQEFYNQYTNKDDFDNFITNLEKLGLDTIIGNPQLLQIMIDAYSITQTFTSKTQAFQDCIESAVNERNKEYNTKERPNSLILTELSEQIFACCMLSGIAGIHTNENNADLQYPFYKNLAESDAINFKYLFDTKLFKPSDKPETHEPIHRIIAEFCAAKFINRKINDPQSKITINMILSLIAPNNTVRDDLRGLTGWLATLSNNKEFSQKYIELDAYAVIAYGNVSQLSEELKIYLLEALIKLSNDDPFFQRHDKWRDIILLNFFNEKILEKVSEILLSPDTHEFLKDFLWGILIHSKADCSTISDTMYQFIVNDKNKFYTRTSAIKCINWTATAKIQPVFDVLIQSNTKDSLALIARILNDARYQHISSDDLLKYVEKLTIFFPIHREYGRGNHFERKSNITYFLKTLEADYVVLLLDKLTENLKCRCKQECDYQCDKIPQSKLISFLIDVFLKTQQTYYADQLYTWLKYLNFGYSGTPSDSYLVKILQASPRLKRKIISLLFENTQGHDATRNLRHKLHGAMHAGLHLCEQDCFVLARWAYKKKLYDVWTVLYEPHNKNKEIIRNDKLRHLLRYHSKNNTEFLKIWSRLENNNKKHYHSKIILNHTISNNRRRRKRTRQNKKILINNKKAFHRNKALIENGEYYNFWLENFAREFMYEKELWYLAFVPNETKIKALSNCLPFMLKCINEQGLWDNLNYNTLYVVYAGCFLHFEKHGNLDTIEHKFLRTLKKSPYGLSSDKLGEEKTTAFEQAINQVFFKNDTDRMNFLKEISEPVFNRFLNTEPKENEDFTDNLWFDNEFKNIIPALSQEWLKKYTNIPLDGIVQLFNHASKNENDNLKRITSEKYHYFCDLPLPRTRYQNSMYEFWAMRAFCLLDNDATNAKKWLKNNPDNIFTLYHIIDHNTPKWVIFSAQKVFDILNAFVDIWKPVHLPNSWGSDSPPQEKAYRLLKDNIVWKIGLDKPDEVIKYCNMMLSDTRYEPYYDELKTHYAEGMRKKMLSEFQPPEAKQIKSFFDNQQIVSVEYLRAFIMDKLEEYQVWLKGASTTPLDKFYESGKRVDEERVTKRVTEDLELRLNVLNLSLKIETHMNEDKRCDITINKNINGQEILLCIEAKGQWHSDLFNAPEEQLYKLYSKHPNAQKQGIYLVYWFGKNEKVANKNNTYESADDLKTEIISSVKPELRNQIDVFVLNLEQL